MARVTKVGGPDFGSEDQRIATIDNDGTFWTEQPMYTEFVLPLIVLPRLPRDILNGRRNSPTPQFYITT